MSKISAVTRSTKARATDGGSSERMDALEGNVQELDGKITQLMEKSPTNRESLKALVLETVGDTLDAHADAIKELMKTTHKRSAEEEDKTIPEGIKTEISSLRQELESLRLFVEVQFDAIWKQLSTLKATKTERSKNPMSDEEDQLVCSPKKEKTHSSRTRSTRKERSSSSRRTRKTVVVSDFSESESELSDGRSSDDEDDKDGFIADEDCRTALKVTTYRLKDRNPRRDTRLKTVKVLADLKHLFDGDKFSGEDPLTVLHFLEELKVVFDDAGICEGDARHMFRYFLTGDALRLFKGLTTKERDAYPQILRWMLRTYVRENLLQEARDEFFARSQKSDETEQEYAEALRELSRRCVGMLSEREIRTRFVRGLVPSIRTHVSGKIRKSTTWADAISIAADYGNAERETRKAEPKREDRYFAPFSRKKTRPSPGALVVSQPRAQNETEGQLAAIADAQYDGEAAGTDLVGALPWGGHPISRNTSFGSYRSSGSSSTQFHTPLQTPFPPPTATHADRKVMLPPGVPYPARKTGEESVQPCLGCGNRGHWISDCKTTNPETRELILEALRARKAKRAATSAGQRSRFGQVQRNLVIAEKSGQRPVEPAEKDEEVENQYDSG